MSRSQAQSFVTVTPLDPEKFHCLDYKVECQRCRFSMLLETRSGRGHISEAYDMAQYHSERCQGNAVAIKSANKTL